MSLLTCASMLELNVSYVGKCYESMTFRKALSSLASLDPTYKCAPSLDDWRVAETIYILQAFKDLLSCH